MTQHKGRPLMWFPIKSTSLQLDSLWFFGNLSPLKIVGGGLNGYRFPVARHSDDKHPIDRRLLPNGFSQSTTLQTQVKPRSVDASQFVGRPAEYGSIASLPFDSTHKTP